MKSERRGAQVRWLAAVVGAALLLIAGTPAGVAEAAPQRTECSGWIYDQTIDGDLIVASRDDGGTYECNLVRVVVTGDVVIEARGGAWIINSVVRGDVVMQPTGDLYAEQATVIEGSVKADRPKGISIAEATINGDIVIDGTRMADPRIFEADTVLKVRGWSHDEIAEVKGDIRVRVTDPDSSGMSLQTASVGGSVVYEAVDLTETSKGAQITETTIGGDLALRARGRESRAEATLRKLTVGGEAVIDGFERVEAGSALPSYDGLGDNGYGGTDFGSDVALRRNGAVEFHHNTVAGRLSGAGNKKIVASQNSARSTTREFAGALGNDTIKCSAELNGKTVTGTVVVDSETCRLSGVTVNGEVHLFGGTELKLSNSVVTGRVVMPHLSVMSGDTVTLGSVLTNESARELKLSRSEIVGGVSGDVCPNLIDVRLRGNVELRCYSYDEARKSTKLSRVEATKTVNISGPTNIDKSKLSGGINLTKVGHLRIESSELGPVSVNETDLYYEGDHEEVLFGSSGRGNRITGDVAISNVPFGQIEVIDNEISGSLGGEENWSKPKLTGNRIAGGTWGDFA